MAPHLEMATEAHEEWRDRAGVDPDLDMRALVLLIWSADLGPSNVRAGKVAETGPRSTATVAGDLVYALSSAGELACLTTGGKSVWRTNLVKDLRGAPGPWGYAESPLVDGGVLVCTPGGPQATLAGLNRRTGAVLWKSAVDRGHQAAYASPIVAEA